MKKLIFASFIALSLLIADNANAGFPDPPTLEPTENGCCQFFNNDTNEFECAASPIGPFGCPIPLGDNPIDFFGFFSDSTCDDITGRCEGFEPTRNVPTMSEWGLIAMAGVMGIIGYMILRRRKAAA